MNKYIATNLNSFIKKDAKKIKKYSQLNLTEIQNKLAQGFGYRHFHQLNKELDNFKSNPLNYKILEEMSFSERLDFSGEFCVNLDNITTKLPTDFILSCVSMSSIPFTQLSYTKPCGAVIYEYDFVKNKYQVEMTTNELKKYFLEYLKLIEDKILNKTVGIPYAKTKLYTPCHILTQLIFGLIAINNDVFSKDTFFKYAKLDYLYTLLKNTKDELLCHSINAYFTTVLNLEKMKSKNLEEKYFFHKDVLDIFELILSNKFLSQKSENKINVTMIKEKNIKIVTHERLNKKNYETSSFIRMLNNY